MKKYVFEAERHQLEKSTEPKYIFNTTAKVIVYAENMDEARLLAASKLEDEYYETGVALGAPNFVAVYDLPIDWNYGYGDGRGTGTAEDMDELKAHSVIC